MNNDFRKAYVLVITNNDHVLDLGGTSKVIVSQSKLLETHDCALVVISPFRLIKEKYSNNRWLIRYDGEIIRVGNEETIIKYLHKLEKVGCIRAGIQIHHLMNCNIRSLTQILLAVPGKIAFYLHDFYTVCPSINLMKNDMIFCGNGKKGTPKCIDCKYNNSSANEIIPFFQKFEKRLTFIAPSSCCKQIWESAYPEYSDKIKVLYHQTESGIYREATKEITDDMPIKIAYVGAQTSIKGWTEFCNVVKAIHNEGYSFYYFGTGAIQLGGVTNVSVNYNDNLSGMIEALRENDIAIAILWSKCPETYSYTYYECMAAGSFVVTHKDSGNIADQIKIRKNGYILDSERKIIEILSASYELRKHVNDFRKSQKAPLYLKEVDTFEELKYSPENISGMPQSIIKIEDNADIVGGVLCLLYKMKILVKMLLNRVLL